MFWKGVQDIWIITVINAEVINLYTKPQGNNVGLYCSNYGAWIKWLGKNEVRAFEHDRDNIINEVNKSESMNYKME